MSDDSEDTEGGGEELCPLCGRPMVPGPSVNQHHLVPRRLKGRVAVAVHKICHDKIHAVFGERELAREYNTFEKLREHPEIEKFIKWVSRKPPEFTDGHEGKRR